MQFFLFLLQHTKIHVDIIQSCTIYHQYIFPKSKTIFLHKHNSIITRKKTSIHSIIANIQSTLKSSQLSPKCLLYFVFIRIQSRSTHYIWKIFSFFFFLRIDFSNGVYILNLSYFLIFRPTIDCLGKNTIGDTVYFLLCHIRRHIISEYPITDDMHQQF